MSNNDKFETRLSLQVSVQIIKHIASGLYRSPASALKELVSNSFDADAHNVNIGLHFSYDNTGTVYLKKISLKDDGMGMDLNTLEFIFTHIGGSAKGSNSNKTPEGRDMIGRLGIGMLSVASACRSFLVRTKKKNEEREYSADISLQFFDDVRELTKTMDKFSIGNVVINSRSKPGFDQYTIIEIKDFRPPFLDNIREGLLKSHLFQKSSNIEPGSNDDKLYQEYFEGFVDSLVQDEKLLTAPVLDQIIATLGLMSPVEYLENGPVRSSVSLDNGTSYQIPGTSDENYLYIKTKLKNLNFSVYINIDIDDPSGRHNTTRNYFKLYKPILYPTKKDLDTQSIKKLDPYVYVLEEKTAIIENEPGEEVKTTIRGYAYHQDARILPHEYRGILYRVYNVAIGDYFKDDLRLYSESPVLLHQMFVEVYLDEGFQSIVNLDRENLFEGARTYVYLRKYMENMFNGKVPEKLPVPIANSLDSTFRETDPSQISNATPSTNGEPSQPSNRRDINFYDSMRKLLPARPSIISNIKERTGEKRKHKLEKNDPTEPIKNIAKEKLKVPDIKIATTKVLDDFGLIVFDANNKEATLNVPKFQGSRASVWENIFTVAATWGPKDANERKEFMKALYTVYKISEGKEEGT